MSQQQVKQFLNDVKENEELQAKLKDALDGKSGKDINSANKVNEHVNKTTEFASAQGYDFTGDEYRAVQASRHMEAKGELSEEELEAVAGGTRIDILLTTVCISW